MVPKDEGLEVAPRPRVLQVREQIRRYTQFFEVFILFRLGCTPWNVPTQNNVTLIVPYESAKIYPLVHVEVTTDDWVDGCSA